MFHNAMHEAVLSRLELESDLRNALEAALEGGQLYLLYQPKISIGTNRMTGVEALLRWKHPERGVVAPLDFIPLAEETGLILPIGTWIIAEACRQSARWKASYPDELPLVMSVNVSARQFEPALVETVREALASTGIDPATLCLEVTESILMHDVETAVAILHQLKVLGVKISVDDFGTGYSSLTYLKQFPLDELKIDKSFVDGLGQDANDGAIVAAVMAVAHALDLTVVGEGVETAAQLAELAALGCEGAQGFYFSRPQPAAGIDELLSDTLGGSPVSETVPGAIAAGRETVLVVDDSPEIREMVRLSLAPSGFVVYEAASGEEALALARRLQPDSVLLDLSMPGGMSGFGVCQALRADPSTSGCTVMMLTSSAGAAEKVEAFSLGADDFIIKPVVPRDLVSRLTAAVGRRKASAMAQ